MKLISHPSEGNLNEKLLTEHLFNVAENSQKHIEKQLLNLSLITKEKLQRLSFLIGIFHDFGKATTWFQKYIRGLEHSSNLTNHSFFSAVVTYYAVKEDLSSDLWAYVAFQVVLNHHKNLSSYDVSGNSFNFASVKIKLENIYNTFFKDLYKFYKKFNIDLNFLKQLNIDDFKEILEDSDEILDENILDENQRIELFFINNYLFSLLIDFDKLDAARLDNNYFNGNLKESFYDINKYLKYLRRKNPEKFNPDKSINKLRNEFLNSIILNDKISSENHFYSITAPTGIGKTFGCLAFANKLKNLLNKDSGRIIYCLPYTSIIDQNFLEFEKIIKFHKKEKYESRPTRYLLKHHYLTPKEISNRTNSEKKSLKDYLDDQLLVESWQSAVIVTTFVQLFHSIIGYKNRFLKKFHNIVNSIVILDEIQNIDPNYYYLIQKTFEVLGKRFGIYFLLITATQPKIMKNHDVIELVDSKKYMTAKDFNRVKLFIDKNQKTIEEFTQAFIDTFSDDNCLIVMNSKKFAFEIYNILKENFNDYKIYCLTTNLTPYDRKLQIKEIRKHLKNNEKIIVVSTQLIEAGVDLSFKIVYRDYAPLDSIIQVAGRCNRNNELGELGGKMFLVNLNNFKIYNSPILKQYLDEILIKNKYESKDFHSLTQEYFAKFNFRAQSQSLLSALKDLNYDDNIQNQTPISKFSLIDEKAKKTIFILRTKEAEQNMLNLISYKKQLKEDILTKEEKDNIRLNIEKLKHKLLDFQISVYEHELSNYINYIEPAEELTENSDFPYIYLTYQFQKDYAYDENIGFLKEPKKTLNSALVF